MEFELVALERIKLLELLPAQGDIISLRIIRGLREELSFTEEEHATLNLRAEENRITWDVSADRPRKFDFGRKATEAIVSALRAASQQKVLPIEAVPLYEKFVAEE